MAEGDVHVRFKRGCWYVERDGDHTVVPIYRKKAAAKSAADSIARREGVEVILHSRRTEKTATPAAGPELVLVDGGALTDSG